MMLRLNVLTGKKVLHDLRHVQNLLVDFVTIPEKNKNLLNE